ncbi:MAG: PepSY domain-containing protein [Sphingomonadales bacterium]|nr:PepSY domain-containing protein [Sphingomonadales bacterium]
MTRGRRLFWRDLHAVTGFWVSGLALVLLVTGLPWAGLWGSAFKTVRAELGWVKGEQDWTLGGEDVHAGHDHAAMMAGVGSHAGHAGHAAHRPAPLDGFDEMVLNARAERIAFPAVVTPPGAPGRFGKPGANVWTIRSDAQNRPERMTLTYDPATRRELSREGFADGHVIDRVVGYGIAWHEGQLFGWVNQLIGVLSAIGLVLLAVSGFIMWRRRKPADALGAPPASSVPARMGGAVAILLVLAALLPLLAISLVGLWLIERALLPRMPGVARWLGVPLAPA